MNTVPMSQLLLPPSPPAGMDIGLIAIHQAMARKTREAVDYPISVHPEGEYWRVCDGRHRVIGWHAGGRTEIEAELCEGDCLP